MPPPRITPSVSRSTLLGMVESSGASGSLSSVASSVSEAAAEATSTLNAGNMNSVRWGMGVLVALLRGLWGWLDVC